MLVTIHQPQFLPWLGYLAKIDQADLFVALDNVQFKKNEWQNRNRVRTAQGQQWLTVPVLHRFGQRVNEVGINTTVNWKARHLRALELHYARARYREPYLSELRDLYDAPWTNLSELNLAVLRWLMRSFHITTPIRLASAYDLREEATDRLIDICLTVGADRYLCGPGAEAYMDRPRFLASGLRLEIQYFYHPFYVQCYDPFMPALSAIDLLFCHGSEAGTLLRQARQTQDARAAIEA
ncbi:MAG: hypothetical protein OJF47_000428 [Nitrospira sp.]|jgi:hypothetical protein|nr:MAG: hypothetical protein OJF47_000428 [Nitrospira sp.]